MAVTSLQIAEQALRELAALGVGQAPAAEDAAAVNVVACVATLKRRGAADLVSDLQNEAIGDEYLLPLARYCAGWAGPSFGVPASEALALQQLGEREVRAVALPVVYINPVPAEYF